MSHRIKLETIHDKIKLLSYGLKTNEYVDRIYTEQNPYDQRRTGNIGLQLLIGEECLPANVPVYNKFTERSSYYIYYEGNGMFIGSTVDSKKIPIKYIPAPNWYRDSVGDGKYAGEYALQEGESTLIASITETCGYLSNNSQCAFCAIGNELKGTFSPEKFEDRKERLLRSIYTAIDNGQSSVKSINLTGGNSLSPDRGVSRYIDYLLRIREKSSIPICLEISPPNEKKTLFSLKNAGASTFMMNIEIWDEKIRKLLMPGKSEIKRNEYINSWKESVEIVGFGNVSSVIIIGLEDINSSRMAINQMVQLGVIPSIMPFRPNNGAILENFRLPNHDEVMQLTLETAELLKKNGISIKDKPGCIGCGACAAECDALQYISNNGG